MNPDKGEIPTGRVRLESLDAVRGFDMLWIAGGSAIGGVLAKVPQAEWVVALRRQLEHVEWEGLRAYDVIFPLFVFLAGVSLVFSLERYRNGGRARGAWRLLRRAVLLFALGVFVNGGMSKPWPDVRLMGVLQRIALASFGAGLLVLFLRTRGLIVATVVLLVGYWAVLKFIPVPGGTAGSFVEGQNLADWFDARFLPGRKYLGLPHDPEGILSTFPAIATALLGVFAGQVLRSSFGTARQAFTLIVAGAVAFGLGYLWSLDTPVIKKIWTPSFVLETAGISAALLGFFHLIIEALGLRLWARPLAWIGANSLVIYLLPVVFDMQRIADRLLGGSVKASLGTGGEVLHRAVPLVVIALVAYLLHSRGRHFRA